MEEKMYFSIYDELDNEIKCEILSVFKLPNSDKNYMIYTDNSYNNVKLNVYAATFDPNDETVFDEIKTQEEWNEINKEIDKLRSEL